MQHCGPGFFSVLMPDATFKLKELVIDIGVVEWLDPTRELPASVTKLDVKLPYEDMEIEYVDFHGVLVSFG